MKEYTKDELAMYADFLRGRNYPTPQVFFQKHFVLLWLGEGLTRRLHPKEAYLVGKFLMEAADNAQQGD